MKFKLTTITPCHIGSGNTLNRNIDFVSDGRYFGIIDLRKIYDIVGENGIAGWCRVIDAQGDIIQYLQGIRPGIKIEDISSRLMRIDGGNISVTGIREHISTMGVPYIPGSSIKGAIVSALIASVADNKLTIPPVIKKKNGVVDRAFSACEERRDGRKSYDPKTSVLRFLRVGDATSTETRTVAKYCNSLNIRDSRNTLTDNKGHQYVEAIDKNYTAYFDLNIKLDYLDKVLKRNIPIGDVPEAMTSIPKLLKCINSHTLSLLEYEREDWGDYDYPELDEYLDSIDYLIQECEKCSDGRSAVMRMGYGSGWYFITGRWSKIIADDDEWEKIKDVSRPKNFMYKDYIFPKTRRTFNGYLPFGFVKISIDE